MSARASKTRNMNTGHKTKIHSMMAALIILVFSLITAAFAQAPSQIDTAASCTDSCHGNFFKKKNIHPAASKGTACVKCHKLAEPGKHAFKPMAANKSELCFTCHDEEDEAKKQLHKPVKAGTCTKCHDPHQSDQAKLLKKAPPQLCFGCHDEEEFQGKSVHGPAAEGKCLSCHHPHASENKSLLVKKAPELCFGCHSAQLKDPKGRMLSSIKSQYEDKEAVKHPPFVEGKCSTCHLPHASATRRLLAGAFPDEFYATYSADSYKLCFSCHSSKKFEEARTLTQTGFRNGNLNLHYRHVNRDKGRTCTACHSAHVSRQPRLIHSSFQFGDKVLGIKFEKTETGGNCEAACHAPIKYDRCKPEVITMKTSPKPGNEATPDELKQSCDKDRK